MTQWNHEITGLARIWCLGNTDNYAETGKQLAAKLRKHACFRGFDKGKFESLECVEDFNTALADLYDYADDHQIWIDPSTRDD